MKAVLFAYSEIGTVALETLLSLGTEIQGLWTHEEPLGEKIWSCTPRSVADRVGIPVWTPENPNQSETIAALEAMAPDYLFSFYYRKMLSERILKIPRKAALNLHGSYLPKYRGRAPVNWAILRGEKETGITLHHMTRDSDAGDIVMQHRIVIDRKDTAKSLIQKMALQTREMLRELFPALEAGELPRISQRESEASYFSRRIPENGRIDWKRPAEEIYNLVRALTDPYPGAFSYFRGEKWFLWWAEPEEGEGMLPGEITLRGGEMWIGAGKGRLRVEGCQLEAGPVTSGKSFASSMQVKKGERMGEVGVS